MLMFIERAEQIKGGTDWQKNLGEVKKKAKQRITSQASRVSQFFWRMSWFSEHFVVAYAQQAVRRGKLVSGKLASATKHLCSSMSDPVLSSLQTREQRELPDLGETMVAILDSTSPQKLHLFSWISQNLLDMADIIKAKQSKTFRYRTGSPFSGIWLVPASEYLFIPLPDWLDAGQSNIPAFEKKLLLVVVKKIPSARPNCR